MGPDPSPVLGGRDAQASSSDVAFVASQVRAASTSFYGAMRILGRQQREAIFAVYAFCREVDDIADDTGRTSADRQRELDKWQVKINNLYRNKADNTICRALLPAIEAFKLDKADFLAIIDGMRMDADGPIIAPDLAVFDLYCDRVASAVGRLCVHIFGEPGPAGKAVAHHLGRALQITNILRDVAEDAELGRLYVPAELLQRHGIDHYEPIGIMQHPFYPCVWRELAQDARSAFDHANQALAKCDKRKMRPARIMLEVYSLNLQRMMALRDDELSDPGFSKRLVGKAEKVLIALRHGLF